MELHRARLSTCAFRQQRAVVCTAQAVAWYDDYDNLRLSRRGRRGGESRIRSGGAVARHPGVYVTQAYDDGARATDTGLALPFMDNRRSHARASGRGQRRPGSTLMRAGFDSVRITPTPLRTTVEMRKELHP
ncbi:MAG: hypothetical protein NVSMB2_27450 [Chloroflexota bacterium]